MFRNQYDTDVTTFSPAGRIHHVEYAIEAVKQGSAVVGVRSREIAVLAALKRSPSELASHQKKLFKVDEHVGIGVSGLIADARLIGQYMRNECLNHKYVYESPMPAQRLVAQLSDKSQVFTQKAEKRPYGVGLLVIAHDNTGPHLFQTIPSGIFYEYRAQAMGSRSQSAKTYLEKHFLTFEDMSLDDLIKHALTALKGTAQSRLTHKNCSIAYVGKNRKLTIIDDDDMKPYVAQINQDDSDDGGGPDEEKKDDSKSKDKTDKEAKRTEKDEEGDLEMAT